MALTNKLSAIGDAIRAKTGKSELMTLDQMPQEIAGISGGGSGEIDSLLDGTITSLKLESTSKISNRPLYYQSNLTTVDLPNVESVTSYNFYFNSNLADVNLPKVNEIQSNNFNQCNVLTSLDLPLLETAGVNCFYNLLALEELHLPKCTKLGASDTYYSSYCIYGLSKIKKIILPKVTVLGEYAITNCTALQTVDLGSATGIGLAIRTCSKLETLIIRTPTLCSLTSTSALTSTAIAQGNGYIYVPQSLVEDYKNATNWTKYASQIRAIEDYPEICGSVM